MKPLKYWPRDTVIEELQRYNVRHVNDTTHPGCGEVTTEFIESALYYLRKDAALSQSTQDNKSSRASHTMSAETGSQDDGTDREDLDLSYSTLSGCVHNLHPPRSCSTCYPQQDQRACFKHKRHERDCSWCQAATRIAEKAHEGGNKDG